MVRTTAKTGRQVVEAAGALAWRSAAHGRAEVLIVHRPKYDDWSIPKGKLLTDEPAPAAAVREVLEETGVRIRLGPPLPGVRYPVASGMDKAVRYWSAEPVDGSGDAAFEPNKEVDRREWLPLGEAARRLTHAHDRALLSELSRTPTHAVVVLRHARAKSRDSWPADDLDRPLTEDGTAQAQRLVPVLGAYGIGRVVSSPALRCVDTVLPYAARHRLEVETDPSFAEGVDPAVVVADTHRFVDATEPALLCTHRPTLPAVLDALGITPVRLQPAEMVVVHLASRKPVAVEHLPAA